MSRDSKLKDYGIDEEIDPKLKFNSLISITVSTLMCLSAKCPVPKPNVETTKLFLRTITDDKRNPPRNIKGLLTFLNHYSGPYEADSTMEKYFEDSVVEQLMIVGNKPPVEANDIPKSQRTWEILQEIRPALESQHSVKKTSKSVRKETSNKGTKYTGLRISPSKTNIISKT